MEHWKVLSATMVGRQKKCSNSRRSRMAKTIKYWPWRQPFDSFCFETFAFLPLSPFFLFAAPKSGAGGSYGPLAPHPPFPPRSEIQLINSKACCLLYLIKNLKFRNIWKNYSNFSCLTVKAFEELSSNICWNSHFLLKLSKPNPTLWLTFWTLY